MMKGWAAALCLSVMCAAAVHVGGAGGTAGAAAAAGSGGAAAPCSGQEPIRPGEVSEFFGHEVKGQKTRAEVVAQVDRVLLDLEEGCTKIKDIASGSELFEKLQTLTWQFLHDGPRLQRTTELRMDWLVGEGAVSKGELLLLAERVRSLRAYGNDTAAHGEEWPSPGGRAPYPRKGCGRFPREPVEELGRRSRGNGGWLRSPLSESKWGGGGECTVRILTVEEWNKASNRCLAALFARPFMVRGGADEVLNRSLWTRDSMLEVLGDYTMAASYIDDPEKVIKETADLGSDMTSEPTFAQHLENVRREAEDGEAVVHVSRTPLRTRGVLYEHVFGGSDMVLQYHDTMLRGMHLPKQLDGFVHTHSPLLVNLALGAGGSGVTFHRHDAALNAVMYGAKRWMLYPPIPADGVLGADKAAFRQASWLEPTAT